MTPFQRINLIVGVMCLAVLVAAAARSTPTPDYPSTVLALQLFQTATLTPHSQSQRK
jgi:hypothetical protein